MATALPMHGFHRALGEDRAGVLAVLQAGADIGLDPDELALVIERESGWNPLAKNPSTNAQGLIQWMPRTRAGLGMPDPIPSTRAGQAPWVKRYFEAIGRPIPPGDVYLAMFYPRAIGKPDDYVIFSARSEAWCKANPKERDGWCLNAPYLRESPTGPITAGSVRRAGSPMGHVAPLPEPQYPVQPAGDGGFGAIVLITFLGVLPFASIVMSKGAR